MLRAGYDEPVAAVSVTVADGSSVAVEELEVVVGRGAMGLAADMEVVVLASASGDVAWRRPRRAASVAVVVIVVVEVSVEVIVVVAAAPTTAALAEDTLMLAYPAASHPGALTRSATASTPVHGVYLG